jgi:L-iditol 2-dehydrogenase
MSTRIDSPLTQTAVQLHSPSDLRVEEWPHPGAPGGGEVLLRVAATGVCGSDLHPYETGTIGSTQLEAPLVLGHEFAGVIEELGAGVELTVGARVAVDPAWTCGQCQECASGNPNLCRKQRFCGLYPDHGSLCQWIIVPAKACHAVPDAMTLEEAALLEPLGIALHATDLARIRVGSTVAVLGAGPVGLSVIQTVQLAGASRVYVSERLPWRLEMAEKFGAVALPPNVEVDVTIEVAWANESVQQAMETTRPGGTVVLVGIPFEDRVEFPHSLARRKGLTILFSRRMKHVYQRAMKLVASGKVDVKSMITHRFSLEQAPEAFAMNAKYQDNVMKVMIKS